MILLSAQSSTIITLENQRKAIKYRCVFLNMSQIENGAYSQPSVTSQEIIALNSKESLMTTEEFPA